jgi:tetratricopeptide (TPR) repeat protein
MERLTEALGILNEFSTNPIPESQFYLAVSHTGLKMYNPALQIWQRLFSQYPKTLIYRQGYTYTEFILGVMSFQEGNFIEAIHHWEACKLVSPEVSEIQECLAEAYFRQGIFLLIQGFLDSEIKESEKYFYKAQELIPDDIRLPFYIGIYTLAKGDSETAISIFESLAGKNAFSGREYLYLAASHLQKGQLQEAKENLRLANSINDKDLPAYAFLSGCIASVENQWEVAFSEYKKVLLPSATLPTN